MKWHTASFGSSAEIAEKERLEAAIVKFWLDFGEKAEEITRLFLQNKGDELVVAVKQILGPVHDDLCWEISRAYLANDKSLILTVTAEDNFGLRSLASALIKMAPKLKGWQFTQFKIALPGYSVTSHTGVTRDYSDAMGKISSNAHGCFDLTIRSKNFKQTNNSDDWTEVYLTILPKFGEELVEVWIDGITTEPNPSAAKPIFGNIFASAKKQSNSAQKHESDDSNFDSLDQIRSKLMLSVAERIDALPLAPCWDRKFEEHFVVTSKNQDAVGRYSFTTPDPAVVMAHGRRFCFYSSNFNRHDEKYCYLKLIGSFCSEDTLDERYAFEDRVDRRLRAEKAGCLLGGGIGANVGFVDVLLSDLPKAVDILRDECVMTGLPKSSWLLFMDTDYCDEWVAMYEDSPPPPPREPKHF